MKIKIYTDGACSGNPGKGGWAAIILDSNANQFDISGNEKNTTNNRMELMAPIMALKKIKKRSEIIIYTDSRYVSDSVEKKWVYNWEKKGFKNKKNSDLWSRFLKTYSKHKVKFFWIKGHNNNKGNERCDLLAVRASKRQKLIEDLNYEKSINKRNGSI